MKTFINAFAQNDRDTYTYIFKQKMWNDKPY